jgi:hypothetical protein
MLRKLIRRKVRDSFAVDKMYHGLILDKSDQIDEKYILQRAKVCTKDLGDDLFCHMLIQREKIIKTKMESNRPGRLFLFYPNYIPLVDSKTIITKSEYHWLYNTIEYPCIRCNKETISYFDDFSLKNLICGECVSKYYTIGPYNKFGQSKEDKENSGTYIKNTQNFFQLNKDRQKRIFTKLIKRQKSFYSEDMTLPKRNYLMKLTKIQTNFDKLVD